MGKAFSVSTTIDAPPERIWSLLTDANGYRDWNPSVISLEGRIARGETIALVSAVNPKRTFRLKVTEAEPPRRMVWADGMPLGLFRGERTFTLAPNGSGTAFSMREEFSGLLAPLIGKAIPDMTESFQQFADGLKHAAEGGAGG